MLALSLSIVACDKECTNHVDENGDHVCDICTADLSGPDNGDEPPCDHKDENNDFVCDDCKEQLTVKPQGSALSSAILAQLEASNSFKLSFEFTSLSQSSSWEELDSDSAPGTDKEFIQEEDYYESKATVEILLSKAQNGFNAMIKAREAYKYAPDDSFDEDFEETEIFLIDGFLYEYDDNLEGYFVSRVDDEADELSSIVGELANGFTLSEEELNKLLESLGDSAVKFFDITNNKGGVSVDLTKSLNDAITYFKELDLETKTVFGLIDDGLALIDPELKIAGILEALRGVCGLTVDQAIAELDAAFTEGYGKDVQGLYESIVGDERFAEIFKIISALQMEADPSDPDFLQGFEAALADLRAFKIKDYIAAQEMGSVVLYDILVSIIAEDGSPISEMTCDELFDFIATGGAMTLAAFDAESDEAFFAAMKDALCGITFNSFKGNIDIDFEGLLMLKSITGGFSLDAENVIPSSLGDLKDTMKSALSLKFAVGDISSAPAAIVLPENAKLYRDVTKNIFYGTGENADWQLDLYNYGDTENKPDGELLIYVPDLDDYVVFYFYGVDTSVYSTATFTLNLSDLTAYTEEARLIFDEGDTITFTLDCESFEFSADKPLVLEIPEDIITAIMEIGYGVGTDNSVRYDYDPALGIYNHIINDTDYSQVIFAFVEESAVFGYVVAIERIDSTSARCTVIGIVSGEGYSLYDKVADTSYIGTVYDNIESYFENGDNVFTIYLEDGLVKSDDFVYVSSDCYAPL